MLSFWVKMRFNKDKGFTDSMVDTERLLKVEYFTNSQSTMYFVN